MNERTGSPQSDGHPSPLARTEALLARRKYLPMALLLLACALVWGRTLSFGFVWDDRYFIVENQALRSPRHFGDLFTRPSLAGPAVPPSSAGSGGGSGRPQTAPPS